MTKHVVDRLLEERAPRLSSGPLWPIIGPILRALMHYRKACEVADAIGPLSGADAFDYICNMLQVTPQTYGMERVPDKGRCILVANHPTGLADGFLLYQVLKAKRPDVCFFANADAHRVCPGFLDILIPVTWRPEERTRQSTQLTLRMAREAIEQERPIVIFPAGRLSRRIDGRIQDPPWEPSAVSLARKYRAPIIPTHVAGPFPYLFHVFDRISQELRQITLFHETLNKVGKEYTFTFGLPIDVRALDDDRDSATAQLKAHVETTLPEAPDSPLLTGPSLVHAE